MSTACKLNHFVWPVGDLLSLKTDDATTQRRRANVATVFLGGNAQNVVNWFLVAGYSPQDQNFFAYVMLGKNSQNNYPAVEYCYHFIVSKLGGDDDTIVSETSGYVQLRGDGAIDVKSLKTPVIKINQDQITEGNYVIHLWLDIFADPQSSVNDQSSSVDNGALSARFRSSLSQVIAGSESPYFDLVIKIGEDKKFYVHRVVLAAHSPVFDTMLSSGSWKERTEGEIEIEDADESTMKDLLYYLYAEKLPDDFGVRTRLEILDLIHLADKYNIDTLKEKIEPFLLHKKCNDQWRYAHWVWSEKYRMAHLKEVCELLLSTKLSVFSGKPVPDSICKLNSKKLALLPLMLTTKASD